MSIDYRQLEAFELEHSLFDLRVDDVPLWERIRFRVFREVEAQNGVGQAHTSVGDNWQDYLRGAGLFAKNLFRKNPYMSNNHDFVYVGHQRRVKRSDGFWWDIYCDPLHVACDQDYIQLERPYLLGHRQPARTRNLRYLEIIDFSGTLLKLLGINIPSIPRSVRRKLQEASDALRTRFQADVDLVSMAKEMLRIRKITLPLYKRLLDRIDPALAVVVVSYGWDTFVEACQTSDIPVVELQHGIIHEHTWGYSYPGPRTKEAFPDYYLAFGDYWKNAVEFPIPDDHVIPVGYPYLENTKSQYGAIDTKQQLLFISQGTIGEPLSKFATNLAAHPDFDYDIVYKLHPGEYDRWRDDYPWLLEADFEIVDQPHRDLYELFAESSAQIGVGSTAVYEGLAFGLETYVYDVSGAEALQPLIEEGAATRISSVEDLTDSIGRSNTSFNQDYYFTPNATSKVCAVLEALKNQRHP